MYGFDDEDVYGGILGIPTNPQERIAKIDSKLGRLLAKPSTPRRAGRIARLMAVRDKLIAKTAAKKGAALAAASIPGVAGGLASSGIRGMDVIEHEFSPEVIRNHNLEGAAQGLRQSSVAPPGSGRLVPIPFVTSGSSVPVHAITGGAGTVGAFTNLETEPVNWAVLRIVALTTQTISAATGVVGVMQDFKIGGSPNLFLSENAVLMDDYDTDKEQFAGLRAYPVLISPNQAFVDVAAFAPAGETLYTAISLVTEVMRDDAFGPGLPGAYAR
jgi:hypothetical protein